MTESVTDQASDKVFDQTLKQIVFTPSGKRGWFPEGTTVLDAARRLAVDLDSLCGGRGACGRCQILPSFGDFPKHKIKASREHVSAWNAVEERFRQRLGLKEGRRLGCQCRLQGDMVFDVPPESQVHRQIIRKRAEARAITVNPAVTLHLLQVAEPDMHLPSGDWERVQEALNEQWQIDQATTSLPVLRQLQANLRQGKWQITVALSHKKEVIAVWPGLQEQAYGAAVDIGSTTMSVHLTNLRSGDVEASVGMMNPQIRFGEDLMSRVSYVMMNPQGSGELTSVVQQALANLLREAAAEINLPTDRILELVLVGNPVMHHLMLGFDPRELGWAPFALATNASQIVRASEIGLSGAVHDAAKAIFLPCVAGHVGADTAAVVLSENPNRLEEISLLVDIGTNAEIVLGNRDRLLACSSPTGPALEGAQISSGQRAAAGAIERVRINRETLEPRFRVIGSDLWSDEPGFQDSLGKSGVTGICGSGIIEALGEMVLAGLITRDGVIDGRMGAKTSRIEPDARTFAWLLHKGENGLPDIRILQADVRAIQLAKAALYAGAQLLIDKLGRYPDRIVLAGAFGSHIDPLYALVLGLIPDAPLTKIFPVGNAAGTGARIALLDHASREDLNHTIRRIEKIETAVEPEFQNHFIAAMSFPHRTASFPNLLSLVSFPEPIANEDGDEAEGGGRRRNRRRG